MNLEGVALFSHEHGGDCGVGEEFPDRTGDDVNDFCLIQLISEALTQFPKDFGFVSLTLEVSLLAFLGGLLVSLPLAAVEATSTGIGPISTAGILGILYLGVVSTALAMYLWNRSLAVLEAGVVSLLFFAQPVVGAGLGASLLGESLTAGFWIGAALIGVGLVVSTLPERPIPVAVEES